MPLLSSVTGSAWMYTPAYVTKNLREYLDAASYVSGTNWPALIGTDATLVNTPTKQSGNGGYISFDGLTQYADVASGASLPSMLDWTVEIWCQQTNNSSAYTSFIAEKYSGVPDSVNYGIVRFTDSGNTGIFAGMYRNGAAAWDTAPSTASPYVLTLNTWYQLVAKHDSSVNTLSFFVNGSSNASTSVTATNTAGSGLFIAKRWDLIYNDCIPCNIGIARIYDRALSSAEISQNFNAERKRFGI